MSIRYQGAPSVRLPFHRRMELRRNGRLETSMIAEGLCRRASGDGSIVQQIDAPMIWSDACRDFVPPNGRLELFKFAGGIRFPASCAFPLGTRIKAIDTATGVIEMTEAALFSSADVGASNGMKISFGPEVPLPGSYACTNTSGSASVTGIASTRTLRKGAKVTGAGVAADTFIAAVVDDTSITLSNVSTAAISALFVQGQGGTGAGATYLTCGSTEGSRFTSTVGSSTLAAWVIANPTALTPGLTVTGAAGAWNQTQDSLVVPIPAGVVQPNARLRLEFTIADLYTSGNTAYQNGVLYQQIALRRAADKGCPRGTGGPGNSYGAQLAGASISNKSNDATVAIGSRITRSGYIEINVLDDVGLMRVDGETGSGAARLTTYLSGYDGAANADFACDCELAFRFYWSTMSIRHMQASLADASLTLIA